MSDYEPELGQMAFGREWAAHDLPEIGHACFWHVVKEIGRVKGNREQRTWEWDGQGPQDVGEILHRSGDPETSKDAARRIARKAAGHRGRILAGMEIELEGSTAREIGAALGIDGAWKRMAELNDQNLVRPGGKRICRIKGQKARTWMLGNGKTAGS